MTIRLTPWDDMASPDNDYTVRLASKGRQVPVYWGKDTAGRCLFIVELQGDHLEQFQKERISVRGIAVDLRPMKVTDSQGLILTLDRHVDRDLFYALCNTLSLSLEKVADSVTALAISIRHLKRWKKFLAGQKMRLLSREEIRGLFGELQFLRILYKEHLSEAAAVVAWRGPEGSHQDFIFENTAVEIKALSGTERNTVYISSEDQLEAINENLYIGVFKLSENAGSRSAVSLNDLVREVESEFTDAEALEDFFSKVAAYGYVELPEYDDPKFVVSAQNYFEVEKGFPRIVRSGLSEGLVRVRYEIELEAMSPFSCSISDLWGEA